MRARPKSGSRKHSTMMELNIPSTPNLTAHLKRSEKVLLELLDVDLRRQIYFLSNSVAQAGFVHPNQAEGSPTTGSVISRNKTRTLNLVDIFTDYHGVFDFFVEFLVQALCSEGILFLIDVVRWKTSIRSELKKIQSKYLSSASATEISITYSARQALQRSIPDGVASIQSTFQAAERETITLLNSDSVPKFLKSKHYQSWLDYLQKVNLITNEKELPIWKKMVTLVQQNSSVEQIQACIEEGGLVHDADDKGRTCLHIAVANKNHTLVVFLLENGADPNILDLNQWTPLHIASNDGDIAIMIHLLEHGASTALETNEGVLPIHYFVKRSKFEVPVSEEGSKPTLVSFYVEDQDMTVKHEHSKFHLFGHKSEKNSKIEKKEVRERGKAITPQLKLPSADSMSISMKEEVPDKLKSLILQLSQSPDNEPLINYKTSRGETPLHYCCRPIPIHIGVLFLLLEKGCHVDEPNKRGETPLEVLLNNPSVDVDLLKRVLTKIDTTNFAQPDKHYSAIPFEIVTSRFEGVISCNLSPEFISTFKSASLHRPLESERDEPLRISQGDTVASNEDNLPSPLAPTSPSLARNSPGALKQRLQVLQQLQLPQLTSRSAPSSPVSSPAISPLPSPKKDLSS
eukprot:TRINITY_DN9576_c0_g1_i1.p1 TRINITY_DN9576_c0_g1~~TRINITY_DN9576_c0_g1_i1.p1  ORF type:complete len:715 (-),score=154.44 TRINITY_DN9576_c0_g1_i1:12-1901(-)